MRKILAPILLLFASIAFALATVDLNTASQAELEKLPGVGSKVASAIVAARPFHSVEDLEKVKGIGPDKFNKIKDMVTVTEKSTTATTASHGKSKATELAKGEMVNINSASLETLEKLPGIGKKKAEAIIQGRPYKAPEDVMKVKGIKMGVYNKIKDHISVD